MASSGVFFAFGITTALVTGLMLNTMMICTLIQASILKTGRKFVSEWEEASFVSDCLVRGGCCGVGMVGVVVLVHGVGVIQVFVWVV